MMDGMEPHDRQRFEDERRQTQRVLNAANDRIEQVEIDRDSIQEKLTAERHDRAILLRAAKVYLTITTYDQNLASWDTAHLAALADLRDAIELFEQEVERD